MIASGASRVTDEMLMAASETGAALAAGQQRRRSGAAGAEGYPDRLTGNCLRGRQGGPEQGVAVKTSAEALLQAISDNFWLPEYRNYRRTSI
ncbi:hypothetical protein KPZU09_11300 [Klebsiella pneumoniae]|uniref:Uncharacterized protein n=1 Tax=Klebsiella pneumoniae TaxID=573 RepID=A0A919HSH9_KLEPN|nr:hypothetical protein KPZU09_11300 [Klebsiella pneumoniae]